MCVKIYTASSAWSNMGKGWGPELLFASAFFLENVMYANEVVPLVVQDGYTLIL